MRGRTSSGVGRTLAGVVNLTRLLAAHPNDDDERRYVPARWGQNARRTCSHQHVPALGHSERAEAQAGQLT